MKDLIHFIAQALVEPPAETEVHEAGAVGPSESGAE